MMRVLLVANSFNCYGANNSLLDMAKALQKRDVDIVVLLPGYGEMTHVLRNNDIEYYVIPYKMNAGVNNTIFEKYDNLFNNIFLLPRVKKIVVERKINLIHTNASNVDFGALISIICHIPHIWHIRELLKEDYNLSYYFPRLEKRLMEHADCLIAISRYVAKQRIHGNNGIVLYNGFDIEKYAIKKERLFYGQNVNILYCGRITEQKGIMDAIKAIHAIVKLGFFNFRLDIVGDKDEYYTRASSYIQKYRLQEYICFHGYSIDMRFFRERADIALMCSRNEALGRVTVESMLGECFVIGANSGGTLELIKDGKTGYLYEAGNVNQLAQKILLVMKDIEQSKKIVMTAKAFAVKRFDNKDYADKILKIYERCINRSK